MLSIRDFAASLGVAGLLVPSAWAVPEAYTFELVRHPTTAGDEA